MESGTLKFYNPEGNYGFVERLETGEVIYFVGKDLVGPIEDGQVVLFETDEREEGVVAIRIHRPPPPVPPQ